MLFIWRGWGWLVPVGTVLLLVAVQAAVEGLGGSYTTDALWPGLAMSAAGVTNIVMGRRHNSRSARTLVDEETFERIQFKQRHDFFFIKMEWWGTLILLGGLSLLLAGPV